MTMSNLVLTPPLFAILSGFIEERVGMSYSASEQALFETKVGARALEAGFASLLDYYYYLRYDDADQSEFRALVQTLLVHETFFFRELGPLRAAVSHLITPRVASGSRVRVWCAACATGEEPLTLAMLLAQEGVLDRVEIVASDLSEAALERARAGRYPVRALRQQPNHPLAARYLERNGESLRAAPELLAAIDYCCLNLMDPEALERLCSFDLIVCRNVLIYFRDARASELVQRLTRRLVPGGALLVGAAESLMRFGSELACEEHGGAFLYVKQATP